MSNQDFRQSQQWREAQAACLSLHNHQCGCCGSGSNLEAHHIADASSNPGLVLEQANLIALCRRCHQGYHAWMGGTSVPTDHGSLRKYIRAARADNWAAWVLLIAGGLLAATLMRWI